MMSSCEDESGTGVPIPSSSTNPDKGQHTERVFTNKGVREFLVIEHTANLRNNTKISAIWHHASIAALGATASAAPKSSPLLLPKLFARLMGWSLNSMRAQFRQALVMFIVT